MRREIVIVCAFLFVFSFLFAQERGIGFREVGRTDLQSFYRESWAVIIGIDNYLKAPKLRYAVKDASEVAKVLIEKFGFKSENVIQLYNEQATKEGITRAFDRIVRSAMQDDRVFIFFAGHGITVQLPDGREKGYILPYDGSQSELITTAISTDQLNEISQLIRAKHLFFVMDACYGGLIFARAQPLSPEAVEYVKVITTRRARKALTAGGRDQTVLDTGPGGHSVFTFYFIDAIKNMSADLNRDGMVSTYELSEYIAPRVTAESNRTQTPEYGILAGDMGGDFVFIPVEAIVEVPVMITSEPEGAEVKIGGNIVGNTPIALKLKPGVYSVEISKSGFEKRSASINVGSIGENRFNFKLNELLVNLNIVSQSKSGIVYIDNQKVGQLKDGKLNVVVKPGRKVIKIEGQEEQGETIVDIPELKEYSVFVDVSLLPGKLTILSNVDTADVYINGRFAGKIKEKKFSVDLKVGKYTIEVRHEKYASKSQEVNISAGDIKTLTFDLVKVVFPVNIKTTPSDAKVYANGKLIGVGSFTTEIQAGKVNFMVDREGYEILEREAVVDRDGLSFEFNLKPIKSIIKIETEPSEAIVLVGGNKVGVTPVSFELPYGSYEIQLLKSGYKSQSVKVDVKRSEVISKKIKLEETRETKALRIYRSRLNTKNNLTYAGVGFTIASVGIALALHIKSEDIYSKYQSATEIEKIRKYRNDYKKVITQRNIAIGVSAVFAGLTVYNMLRKVSFDEIYEELEDDEVAVGFRLYKDVGVVPVVSLRIKM
ncbi:MAG: PEGA domain-containing protein [Candidatus Kryptonium sp.]|nr:PEGA domain-containing protein [Candidatus Kryptonium sp.]